MGLEINGQRLYFSSTTRVSAVFWIAPVELVPVPIPQAALFQRLVVHQTTCQLRDCYLCMGEQPPEDYRVLGFGKYKFAVKYRNDELPMYEDYTRFDADISGYRLGFGIGFDDGEQLPE